MIGHMNKKIKVLAPTRYPWKFNGPRNSSNFVENRNFVPMNWVSKSFEGITVFNPIPHRKFDLVHAFNRIPLTSHPFIIGFESHLPRAFGLENTGYYGLLRKMLTSSKCKGIYAISQFAKSVFAEAHSGSHEWCELEPKLFCQYPNLPIGAFRPRPDDQSGGRFRLIFVGNHFARKGGCVALKIAELAAKRNFPLEVVIVSSLQMGGSIWSDPRGKDFYDQYLQLLTLPSVKHYSGINNKEVINLIRRADMTLLTTFSDTFGYSAIESMANSTPVIATRQGALPEFIRHGENGILIDLETTSLGEWIHLVCPDKSSNEFKRIFMAEVDRMAAEALHQISLLHQDRYALSKMRLHSWETASDKFDSGRANEFWDQAYVSALSGHSS